MSKRGISLSLRTILAFAFLYAAYTKLRQPWLVFAMSIDAYGVLPEMGVLAVARTLPWLELVLGLLLLTGLGLRVVSAITTALLGIFFGLMLMSYGKGMGIDCGCFGVGEPLTWKTLIRDGLMLAASLALTWSAWHEAGARRGLWLS
jgi:uncharacterized membrane protein YphA (DoxX/SURF4 family)